MDGSLTHFPSIPFHSPNERLVIDSGRDSVNECMSHTASNRESVGGSGKVLGWGRLIFWCLRYRGKYP